MHETLSDIKDIASTILSIASTVAIVWKLYDDHHRDDK